jgi:hypothetical protein
VRDPAIKEHYSEARFFCELFFNAPKSPKRSFSLQISDSDEYILIENGN